MWRNACFCLLGGQSTSGSEEQWAALRESTRQTYGLLGMLGKLVCAVKTDDQIYDSFRLLFSLRRFSHTFSAYDFLH